MKSKINRCYYVTDLIFLSRNLFACLQEVISSFHLLSEARFGLQIIKYFCNLCLWEKNESVPNWLISLGMVAYSSKDLSSFLYVVPYSSKDLSSFLYVAREAKKVHLKLTYFRHKLMA